MKKNPKLFLTIFFFGTAYALQYALPFIQYVLYNPLVATLNVTNAQLGVLIAIFGIGNIVGAPIGGWFADRFSYKTIYIISMFGTSALSFLFAFNLNYQFAVYIWIGLAVTALFAFYPSHIKAVRMLGDEESQGKIFGLSESASGIGSVIVNSLALFLFGRATTEALGLQAAIIGYGVASLVVGIVLYFLMESPAENKNVDEDAAESIGLKDYWIVLKFPGTWLAGMAIFVTYTLYTTLTYFTPYFTDVLGVTVAFSGGLAIVRTYLLRFVGAPIGGYIGDKIHSVTKVLGISFLASAIIILAFLGLPATTSTTIIIILTLLISTFTFMARGNMFAVPAEVKSPTKYAAMTAGITCAIGFAPDLFQFTMYGSWLDKYGNDGYRYIFIYAVVILVIGIINSILTLMYKKHQAKQESQEVAVK